jgi:hypothetical protein
MGLGTNKDWKHIQIKERNDNYLRWLLITRTRDVPAHIMPQAHYISSLSHVLALTPLLLHECT